MLSGCRDIRKCQGRQLLNSILNPGLNLEPDVLHEKQE